MISERPAILAVDGGNSKAELALVARDGTLLAALRGPTVSHQSPEIDLRRPVMERTQMAMRRLRGLVARASARAGMPSGSGSMAEVGVLCVAGADFPRDIRSLTAAARGEHLARRVTVLNDSFAPLRAGTTGGWGIALICGAGVNAVGIAPSGRTASFPAVGAISGDWGGSSSVGLGGLKAAVRARDGRGPRTQLERLVPAHFGLRRPAAVTQALYDGRIAESRLRELSGVVFAAATDGDAVARGIVDRLADELATMALAIAGRLHVLRREVDVVLGGGVFRTDDPRFYARLAERLQARMPGARLVRLSAPPVLGAALLGLDRLRIRDRADAEARLRAALTRGAIGEV